MTGRPAQHERILVERRRGDRHSVSTTNPGEAQHQFDREAGRK